MVLIPPKCNCSHFLHLEFVSLPCNVKRGFAPACFWYGSQPRITQSKVETKSRAGIPRGIRRAYRRAFPLCASRSEEHTSELQSQFHLVCRLLLEKKN